MKEFERARGRREMSTGTLAGIGVIVAALFAAASPHGAASLAGASAQATALLRDPRPAATPLFPEPERSFGDPLTTPAPVPVPPRAPAPPAGSGVLALATTHPYPGHPLREGSHGPAVREIQQALGITVDGWFGPQTEHAVREFQDAHDLEVDGVVGPVTWHALFG